MFVVLENLGKLGLGGLFGGALAHILLLFTQFTYADGTPADPQTVSLCGAFLGASLGRFLDRMIFVPYEGSRTRQRLISEIRSQRLPIKMRNDLISKVYLGDIGK